MASILDISPLKGTITLRGKDHEVPGIGAEGIVYLLQRFPVLRAVLMNKELQDLTPDALVALAPEAINAVIAVGLGHINSPQSETSAGNLALDEKLACLEKIMEVTLPNGIAPFVEMLNRVGSKAVATGWARDMSSDAQSSS